MSDFLLSFFQTDLNGQVSVVLAIPRSDKRPALYESYVQLLK
jgi:hypothetical protein